MNDDRADIPFDTGRDRAVGARVRVTAGRGKGRAGAVVSRSVDPATGLAVFVVELDRSYKRVRCDASALEPEGAGEERRRAAARREDAAGPPPG